MTGSIKAIELLKFFKSTIRSKNNIQVGGVAHGPAIGNEVVIKTHMTTDIEGILCFHRFS